VRTIWDLKNPHKFSFQKTFQPLIDHINYADTVDAIAFSLKKPAEKKAAIRAQKIISNIDAAKPLVNTGDECTICFEDMDAAFFTVFVDDNLTTCHETAPHFFCKSCGQRLNECPFCGKTGTFVILE